MAVNGRMEANGSNVPCKGVIIHEELGFRTCFQDGRVQRSVLPAARNAHSDSKFLEQAFIHKLHAPALLAAILAR